jgi:hypothetical protein
MKKIILILMLMAFTTIMVYSQSITQPWWVIDQAGGKSSSGDVVMQASVGQAAIQKMSHIDSGVVLESGYIPGLRNRAGSSTTINLNIASTWNLVSVPVLVNDYSKTALFPTSISRAFLFNNGYVGKDTLQKGPGYWLNFPSAQTVNIQGTSVMLDAISVNAQWNLIGTISYPILVSSVTPIPPVAIQSNFFGFAPTSGYFKPDTLKPGNAYWVKVNQSGQLLMQTGSVLLADNGMLTSSEKKTNNVSGVSKNRGNSDLQSLTITDAGMNERILYFTAKQTDIDLAEYELPPPPPSEIFDVRFESQRNAEVFKQTIGSEINAFQIKISGAKYPLTITWNIDNAQAQYYTLEAKYLEDTKLKTLQYKSTAGEKIVIDNPELVSLKLLVTPMATVELPKEFSLYQNYPNPFNPTTRIKYNLPATSAVKLVIYNILGQTVATVVDEVQEAGYKSVEWSANNVSSGVYFYKLTAGDFVEIKKMLLVR